jgi:hypothetical protein
MKRMNVAQSMQQQEVTKMSSGQMSSSQTLNTTDSPAFIVAYGGVTQTNVQVTVMPDGNRRADGSTYKVGATL